MARIRSIAKALATGKLHPTEVDAEWSVVGAADGSKLLQLSTFGSDARVSSPKVSQTIQVDAAMARKLRDILEETFGDSS